MSHIFVLQIQDQRRPEIVHELKVHFFNTIKDVKRMLETIVNFPADRLRVLLASTMQVLKNTQILNDLPLSTVGPALVVSYGFGVSGGYKVEAAKGIYCDTDTKDFLRQVQLGLNKSTPGKTDALDCTGGVYFMKSVSGGIVGVFKPQDEEQGMPNNPKGHAGNGTQGLRPHFRPGEGYLREYAAYLMDKDHFCKVPTTSIASCEHPVFSYISDKDKGTYPKVGSLQRYVRASDTFEDISESLLSAFEVQKIALFDMRILNCDRNSSNILAVRKELYHSSDRRNSRGESLSSVGELNEVELDVLDFIAGSSHFKESSRPQDTFELIPIDHGYSFPSRLQIDELDWAWFYYSQLTQPVDPRIKSYLNQLNFDDLIAKVTAEVVLSEDTVFLLRTVHDLLVQGVNEGLTLFDIASLIARTEDGVPSPLEKAISRAEESAYSTIEVHEGHRFNKVMAISESNSPVRRGKSPTNTNTFPSTPPHVSELLKMKRIVKSELFQDASTDDGAFAFDGQMKTETGVIKNHDGDYFVNDLEGEQSPISAPKTSVLFSPSFAFQGESLRTMNTMDSSGLTLFFKEQQSKKSAATAASNSTKTNASVGVNVLAKANGSGEPSPVEKNGEHFGDYYEGLTTAEASSYESVGHSPRSLLDMSYPVTSRVPNFGSPTFFQQTVGTVTTSRQQNARFPNAMAPVIREPSDNSNHEQNTTRENSFEAFEVRTFQPLIFEKPPNTLASSNTAEEGYDSAMDGSSMASTPSDHMFENMRMMDQKHSKQPSSAFSTDSLLSIPMARVSSFNALESPPLYNAGSDQMSHRLMRHLRREKRKQIGKSAEFPALRQQYVQNFVKKMISSARSRSGSL